jgi:hypothetical protein
VTWYIKNRLWLTHWYNLIVAVLQFGFVCFCCKKCWLCTLEMVCFLCFNTAVCKLNILIEETLHSHTSECSLLCITDGPAANDFGAVKCPLGYTFNLKSQVCDGEWKWILMYKYVSPFIVIACYHALTYKISSSHYQNWNIVPVNSCNNKNLILEVYSYVNSQSTHVSNFIRTT